MKTFNNLEELKPYYNKQTNTYDFIEYNELIDVEFSFALTIDANINARNINAVNIKAWDIDALKINAVNIKAWDIDAWDIKAGDIDALKINARDINARNINTVDINALDINALDINARDINAEEIIFYGVCVAYDNIKCTSIKGRRNNAKYFCLDSEVTIKKD